jgi:FtsP/CotA-like multicopper oxidase with cupredoxin domain
MLTGGQKMIIVIVVVSLGFAGYLVFPAIDITAQEQPEVFVTHSGAVVQTTGDVLDPVYTIQEVEFDPEKYLRDFDYGEVSQLEDGTTLREFTIIAEDDKIMEIAPGIFYNVWTFNGQVPGPTIRATEGDLMRIHFTNNGDKEHTIHFHGNHPAEMDGIFEIVGSNGGQFTYEFIAGPVGVHPYHCHVMPVEEHIGHGLYGVFIVDPKDARQQADEMVMMLNGFDTDFDGENNLYAANTIPYYYQHHPIQINTNELIRVYVVNMVGLDPINNFHLHGTLYKYYPTGTDMVPSEFTDMTTFSQSERGILEFEYEYTGRYMFHAHLTEFSEKGWSGLFYVKDSSQPSMEVYDYGS